MIHLKEDREQVDELERRISSYRAVLKGSPNSKARTYMDHLAVHILIVSGDLRKLTSAGRTDSEDINRLNSGLDSLKTEYTGWYGSHTEAVEA